MKRKPRTPRSKGYTGPDLSKSLNELPGEHLDDPPRITTGLVTRVHELHRKPLTAMDAADLQLLTSQRFGLQYVVPLALRRLAEDPLLAARFYDGDLLVAVLRVPVMFWNDHPKLREEVSRLLDAAIVLPPEVEVVAKVFRGSPRSTSSRPRSRSATASKRATRLS